VDAKTIHSVFRFIAWVLAVGGSVIFGIVLGSLFQRERARELVAEISRVMKGDRSQTCARSEITEELREQRASEGGFVTVNIRRDRQEVWADDLHRSQRRPISPQ
jgi:hypothetical protein